MTAAKKLKKLEARLSPAGLAGLVETVDSYEALKELGVALPQIVAVVETAEAIRYAVEPLMTPPPTPLGDALDALEEALNV